MVVEQLVNNGNMEFGTELWYTYTKHDKKNLSCVIILLLVLLVHNYTMYICSLVSCMTSLWLPLYFPYDQ